MSDPQAPDETPTFDPGAVESTRGRQQGLGVGARELEAQGDPGGVRTADVDDATDEPGEGGADPDALDQSIGVQGGTDPEA